MANESDDLFSDLDIEKEKLLTDGPLTPFSSERKRYSWIRRGSTTLLAILNIAQACIIVVLFLQAKQKDVSQLTYTPANEAIEYEVKTFNGGYLDDTTIYQSPGGTPTDETDRAWSDLYEHLSYSRIPRHQAAMLTNLTVPIPNDEDHYIIGLDVFHQIHCLDNLRKALWPDRYKPEDNMGGQGMSLMSHKHLDHCTDQLRQALMCNADLSTVWLQWEPGAQRNRAVVASTHTCRNFEKIQQWAEEHRLVTWDDSVNMEDPLKEK